MSIIISCSQTAIVEATRFQLYKRAKHVFAEALRVLQFREICLNTSQDSTSNTSSLESLGRLMNESHASCSQTFECSCPELDELTQLAREAGAYGSRLTGLCRILFLIIVLWTYFLYSSFVGAGWGGYTVSLVGEDQVEQFITKIRDMFGPYRGLEGEALNEVIFATRPSSGACGMS